MADYSGYFLKGLGQGLQTGVNLGTQIQEMKWQKKQRKELEEKQAKMTEVSNLWNAKIKEIYADNKATDEETAQLATIILSGGYDFMDHYGNAMNYIQSMNEKAYKQEIEWINLFIDKTEGLPSGDIQAAFDIISPGITSEKGRNTLEAYSNLQKKRTEALQAQPEDVWGQAGKLPAEIRPEYLRSKGIDIPKAETPETETEMDILKKNKTQLDFYYSLGEKAFDNFVNKHRDIYPSVTFKTYGKGYEETAAGKEPTPITFKTLQDIKESFNNVKTKAEYNEALASYNASKEAKASDWTPPPFENQLTELIKKVETAIWADYVNKETGKLKDKSGWTDYNEHLQHYLNLIEEAKKTGVDISGFQAFIPYKELYWGAGNPLVIKESW